MQLIDYEHCFCWTQWPSFVSDSEATNYFARAHWLQPTFAVPSFWLAYVLSVNPNKQIIVLWLIFIDFFFSFFVTSGDIFWADGALCLYLRYPAKWTEGSFDIFCSYFWAEVSNEDMKVIFGQKYK